MKKSHFAAAVILGMALMTGCTKPEPPVIQASGDQTGERKFEEPKKSSGGFVTPSNMALDEASDVDVPK